MSSRIRAISGEISTKFGAEPRITFDRPLIISITLRQRSYRYETVGMRETNQGLLIGVSKDGDGEDDFMREIRQVIESSLTRNGCQPWILKQQYSVDLGW